MKTTNRILILFIFMSFIFRSNLIAQETHIITLHVNTTEIVKQKINTFANFGQATGITNENFSISVRKGDIIIWKGISSSAPESDIVNITAINHEGGVNVFGQNVLKGNGETPEIVVGTVINGNPGDEEKYKLSFKVFVNGSKKNGTFHIDPKIIVNN